MSPGRWRVQKDPWRDCEAEDGIQLSHGSFPASFPTGSANSLRERAEKILDGINSHMWVASEKRRNTNHWTVITPQKALRRCLVTNEQCCSSDGTNVSFPLFKFTDRCTTETTVPAWPQAANKSAATSAAPNHLGKVCTNMLSTLDVSL